MKLKMQESRFGAPEGTYVGRFLGVQAMKDDKPRIGRDGNPMEPGMEWQFEIVEDADNAGEYVGKIVGRITSQHPTAGNACGTLLRGLIGRAPTLDEEIEPNDYRGQLYRVTLAPGKENPERTQVIQIKALKTTVPVPATVPPPAGGPPPRKPANGAPPLAKQRRFWVSDPAIVGAGNDPELVEEMALQRFIVEKHLDLTTLEVCLDGEAEWKPAASYGFKTEIPF